MKTLAITAILTAAIICEASEFNCKPIDAGKRDRMTIDTSNGKASVFNGKYWSSLEQEDFRVSNLSVPEPVYTFKGLDVFRDSEITIHFNELKLIAEVYVGDSRALNFQCID